MAIQDQRQSRSQHAVPQNIMDVEFKLIGDLTMRQFTYLMVFGGSAYLSYIGLAGFFKWPVTIAAVLLGLALAFVPIQERGMDEWVVNFVKSVYSPTQMIWKKGVALPSAFTYQNLAVVHQELITLAPTSSRRKLEEYLEVQQRSQNRDPLDVPEMDYIMKVRKAFATTTTQAPAEEVQTYSPQFEASQEFQQPAQPAQPAQPVQPAQPAPPEKPEQSQPTPAAPEQPKEQEQKPEPAKPEERAPGQPPAPKVQPAPPPADAKAKQPEPQKPQAEKPKIVAKVPPVKKPGAQKRPKLPQKFMASPLTPDQHVGRKFTRMLPSEGQLVLPVRGEKVLQTSEDQVLQKDIDEKAEQLNKLLNQIKGDSALQSVIAEPEKAPENEVKIDEAANVVQQVKEENEKLSSEIQKLKSSLQQSQDSDEEKQKKMEAINKLEEEQKKANSDYSALQQQVHDLQERLKKKEEPKEEGPKQPKFAKMAPITQDPNIVSGVLRNKDGEGIPGMVMLIKNSKGESVRALKTNSIGQFSISTPLVKGMYTLEVGSQIEGSAFDIITVEIKGEVLPPIEVIGREA